jgi:hypothetical protein
MARLAGDERDYLWALIDRTTGQPTEHTHKLRSVTTIIGAVIPKPFGAGAWWGYRVGMEGVATLLDALSEMPRPATAEGVEAVLKGQGYDPNRSLESAGGRGTAAHNVLEALAAGDRKTAERRAAFELDSEGTNYSSAVISWWDAQDWTERGDVVSERPVWSFRHGYQGTLDLAILESVGVNGVEILDLKTHKPASGFTKPGFGPAYLSDLVQLRAYRIAWEEMGLGSTIGQRVIIARENGNWLEDRREVPAELWLQCLEMDRLLREVQS